MTENTPTSETAPAVNPVLTDIARKHLGIATLAPAHSDASDFYDLAVWNVQAALEAAFEAGRQSKGNP